MPVEIITDIREMFRDAQLNRARADAHIEDWQRELKPGDKAIYLGQSFSGHVVLTYSIIVDPVEDDREFYDLSVEEDRVAFEGVKRTYGPAWAASYRHTRSHSPLEPEGELGDVHLAKFLARLTDEAFEQARRSGWPQVGRTAEA